MKYLKSYNEQKEQIKGWVNLLICLEIQDLNILK